MKPIPPFSRKRKNFEYLDFSFSIFLFCLVCGPSFSLTAQTGCTDDQAFNFDPDALANDGSCVYPFTEFDLPVLTDLSALLVESSGLEWINGNLYTHIDDGPPRLYKIDPTTGTVLGIITLLGGAENIDWEDITESETHVFVGDFGNNSGNRTDLKIYRFDKSDLSGSNALVETIEFTFADQTEFDHNNNAHNFDCEAMFFADDSLHLFSKNWLDGQTKHYVLSVEPGVQEAQVKEVFNATGLVTAADIGAEGVISLLGRTESGTLFCWLLFDYPAGDIFAGHKRKIFLKKEEDKGQIEGMVFTGEGKAYISSEEKEGIPARLYEFSTAEWTGLPVGVEAPNPLTDDLFFISPNPFKNDLTIQWKTTQKASLIRIYDALGRMVLEQESESFEQDTEHLFLTNLSSGLYFLEVRQGPFYQLEKILKH